MKEQTTYVAIDTDDVGESIGNAVLQDDEVSLSSLSEKINMGTEIFSQWATTNGGEVISSGSDEAIFRVPANSIEELERLKGEYRDKTGFSISVGIGGKVSEAAKALIYAKINGKDQIIDYSPEIEMAMKQNISGELSEEMPQGEDSEGEVPEHEENLSPEDKALHDSTEEMSDEEEIDQEQKAKQFEGEDTEQVDVPADQVDGDYGSEEMADAQPEHEKEMSEEEEFIHDAEENREDELDEDIIEADEESQENPDMEEEAMEEMIDSDGEMNEDIDLDGRPDEQEEHGEITPEDDLDQDGDVEHEEAMASEAGEEYDDVSDQGDEYQEGELAENLEDEMSDGEEEITEQDLMDMEGEMAEDMPEEMVEEGAGNEEEMGNTDHAALKSVIFESLQSFKQNREHLEQIKQQNPDLYAALIHTLQAMVEMARDLGYGNVEEEMSEEEPDDMLADEEFMAMGSQEEMQEEPQEEIVEEEPEEEEEEKENPFEKSEKIAGVLQKMKKAIDLMKAANSENSKDMSIEEIKENIKKKIEEKKKGKKKGKKKSAGKNSNVSSKDKKKEGKSNEGSFCAKSHNKMRAAGKDCRAAEDKDSPLCSARKKMNCRGKNEEKGPSKMDKSEKLHNFLSKKRKK